MEKVGLANIFDDIFHCCWWLEASKPSEAIVPEIMETVGFTNNFQDFCYQIHGNYWFQGRKHSKNLGQWGGTIYIYIYICMYEVLLAMWNPRVWTFSPQTLEPKLHIGIIEPRQWESTWTKRDYSGPRTHAPLGRPVWNTGTNVHHAFCKTPGAKYSDPKCLWKA